MVEKLDGMPEGTLGFRISGRLTREEYFQLLDPVRDQLERRDKVSFLIVTDPDFEGLDLGALWEDVKAAGSVGLKHRSSWDRLAVVTDKDWMRHAISAFGWLSPGELRVFEPDELERAKAWERRLGAAPSSLRLEQLECRRQAGSWAGHSMTARAIVGGSRPARSQPAAAAATGIPTTIRTSESTGIRPRWLRSS